MTFNRKLSLFFLAALLSAPGFGAPPDNVKPADIFSQANAAYEKEDFSTAESLYLSLVSKDFASPELYFNLGNVYYRKGERGRAVLWYERALDRAPRDADTRFNLSLARAHIKNDQPDIARDIVLYFTGNELGAALLLIVWFFFVLGGCVLLDVVGLNTGARLGLWISGVLLVIVGAWFAFNISLRQEPRGIIVNPPGEVRNGPGSDYAVGFTIPEGSNVVVLHKRPDWVQIGLPQQGLKGWLPATDVELINPAS
jgi:tetratricopeptide (TPR) repeat protein